MHVIILILIAVWLFGLYIRWDTRRQQRDLERSQPPEQHDAHVRAASYVLALRRERMQAQS
jgi:hypothetical protein